MPPCHVSSSLFFNSTFLRWDTGRQPARGVVLSACSRLTEAARRGILACVSFLICRITYAAVILCLLLSAMTWICNDSWRSKKPRCSPSYAFLCFSTALYDEAATSIS